MTRASLTERFWSRVDKSAVPNGCWVWTGGKNRGYGAVRVGTNNVPAHRFSYELLIGPIPAGLHLDHLCRNIPCVNPAHLEPVTPAVNILRGNGTGAINARKTHCKWGHEFTEDNTYIRPDGTGRSCKECKRLAGIVFRSLQKSNLKD